MAYKYAKIINIYIYIYMINMIVCLILQVCVFLQANYYIYFLIILRKKKIDAWQVIQRLESML